MRRRDLLAAAAAGVLGGTAGCGYAHGGGDLRERIRLSTGGLRTDAFHAVDDDRLVYGTSGRQLVFEDGESTFTEATTVTAWSLGGDQRWSHTHDEPSVAVAAGEDAYLLTESGALAAVAATGADSRTATDGEYETATRWRVDLPDPRPPLAAADGAAYVAREGGLLAVRDGSVAWDRDLPGTPRDLVSIDGVVVAPTDGAVVGVTADGEVAWRDDVSGGASVAAAAGRVALLDGDVLRVRRAADGDEAWRVDLDGGRDPPAMTDAVVYAAGYGGVHAFDLETGDELWTGEAGYRVAAPMVPAPEGVYVVDGGCAALAVDGDGTRWRRELDVEMGCSAVAGWLHGETVAFLFDSGAVRWLQRTDQPHSGSV